MRPSVFVVVLVVLAGVLGALAVSVSRPERVATERLSLADAMRADTTGYALALAPRPFRFPEDHGPHPDYRTEWWYVTGNVTDASGRPFGFELTLFRIALTPPDTASADTSGWHTRQLYMGHFGLTDPQAGRFHAFERFSRGSAGLAGAQAQPFRAWLEDWELAETVDGLPAMRLRAAQDGVSVDLTLVPEKPVVLQGDRGLSQKGSGAGNASYYYSLTRLRAEGRVTVPGAEANVSGTAWMDREWSTSALDEGQVGWDWFALQLDDGRDLMYYHLRERDGTPSRFSSGVLVDHDGRTTKLRPDDVRLTVTEHWTSPHSGARYPAGWTLEVPAHNVRLRIAPRLNDQELNVSVRYWEGAVTLSGSAGGVGYVEMTGYDGTTAEDARGRRG